MAFTRDDDVDEGNYPSPTTRSFFSDLPPPPTFHAHRTHHHPKYPAQPPPPTHHAHHPHLPMIDDDHSHKPEPSSLSNKLTVKLYAKANPHYSLAIRHGKVVLVPSDPSDATQHWFKDEK